MEREIALVLDHVDVAHPAVEVEVVAVVVVQVVSRSSWQVVPLQHSARPFSITANDPNLGAVDIAAQTTAAVVREDPAEARVSPTTCAAPRTKV